MNYMGEGVMCICIKILRCSVVKLADTVLQLTYREACSNTRYYIVAVVTTCSL